MEPIDLVAEQVANNPAILKTMLRNMAVEAVRWRTALERIANGVENGQSFSGTDCQEIAKEALQKEDSGK